MIVDIEYRLKIVFVVWFGTHTEYDATDVKTVRYENKILKTGQGCNDASERIYSLINSTDKPIEPGSPEGEEIELLSLLGEKYEEEHAPVEPPEPIEAIKFRMEQMDLKQVDIAPLLRGKTRIIGYNNP